MYGRSLCSRAQCYSIVSCAPRILIGAHVLSLEINQLHGHIFFVKNRFFLFLRDHSDSRLSPQPPLQHPPVFQLLTDFFGQSGENSSSVLKRSASKMKFRGLLTLKTWRKFGRPIFGLSICFQLFFE